MIERRTLSISLTPELHDFISQLVKEGNYNNSSEVVRAGLRLLRHEEGQRQRSIETRDALAACPTNQAVKHESCSVRLPCTR